MTKQNNTCLLCGKEMIPVVLEGVKLIIPSNDNTTFETSTFETSTILVCPLCGHISLTVDDLQKIGIY